MSSQLQAQVSKFIENLDGVKPTTMKHFKQVFELFCEDYKTQVRPPQDCKILSWGRYKSKTVKDILTFDKNYINWVVKSEYCSPEQRTYIQSLLTTKTEE